MLSRIVIGAALGTALLSTLSTTVFAQSCNERPRNCRSMDRNSGRYEDCIAWNGRIQSACNDIKRNSRQGSRNYNNAERRGDDAGNLDEARPR